MFLFDFVLFAHSFGQFIKKGCLIQSTNFYINCLTWHLFCALLHCIKIFTQVNTVTSVKSVINFFSFSEPHEKSSSISHSSFYTFTQYKRILKHIKKFQYFK